MSILRFLGLGREEKGETKGEARERAADLGETDTVRKIVASLDEMEPERARFVAAFAFILCRVARADLRISTTETQAMERIVMTHGGLPEEQAVLVVQMAKTQSNLLGGTENFLVTREFNKIASHEQKLALLDCLFALASDEMISTKEDNEISQVCGELQISHDEFIAMRMGYSKHRAVLKKPPQTEGDAR